jgi:hypothetical protein
MLFGGDFALAGEVGASSRASAGGGAVKQAPRPPIQPRPPPPRGVAPAGCGSTHPGACKSASGSQFGRGDSEDLTTSHGAVGSPLRGVSVSESIERHTGPPAPPAPRCSRASAAAGAAKTSCAVLSITMRRRQLPAQVAAAFSIFLKFLGVHSQ